MGALDLPVHFDSLPQAGTIMGSWGLIVMDDLSCMVDVAAYFTSFLAEESCGKCVPCREGLPVLLGLLDDLRQGRGKPGHASLLEGLAESLAKTALCGLGQSAANPILSTLRHFRGEYLEHERGFCPAGRCQGLFEAAINEEACAGCGACQKACPASAISGEEKAPRRVKRGLCVGCGACLAACRHRALETRRREAHA
jgi:NADH-quinone oxidoreductase subunit F